MSGGIIGYGTYLPSYRITLEAMALAKGDDPKKIYSSLAVTEKTVAGYDEDTVTMAISAAESAIQSCLIKNSILKPLMSFDELRMSGPKNNMNINKPARGEPVEPYERIKQKIGALYIGSESHPYAVKSSAAIIGTALGIGNIYAAADLEFACKGGTAALQTALGAVNSSLTTHALALGSDVAQAEPDDILSYVTGAGSAAFVVGNNNDEWIATIDAMSSVTEDLPDFWRREGQPYPEHMGRFTAEPAYFSVISKAVTSIMEKNKLTPTDIDYVVFHQPNAKFVTTIAQRLGFTREQYLPGMIVPTCGNCYSATTLIGLAAILDQAQPGQRILVASFGSGAGSDAFLLTTTPLLTQYQQRNRLLLKPHMSFDKLRMSGLETTANTNKTARGEPVEPCERKLQKKYLSYAQYQHITAMRAQ